MAILPDYKHDYDRLMSIFMERLPMLGQKRLRGSYTGGTTAGPLGMMSQTSPTAQDVQALTNRQEERAKYGQYGDGSGIKDLWDSMYNKKKKKPVGQGLAPPRTTQEDWAGWDLY